MNSIQHQCESSAQHFGLIEYIYECKYCLITHLFKCIIFRSYHFVAWSSVSKELDMCHNQSHGDTQNYRNGASVTYYQEREPNPELKGRKNEFINRILINLSADVNCYILDFQPFNLEAWWGQRVVQSITRNTNS